MEGDKGKGFIIKGPSGTKRITYAVAAGARIGGENVQLPGSITARTATARAEVKDDGPRPKTLDELLDELKMGTEKNKIKKQIYDEKIKQQDELREKLEKLVIDFYRKGNLVDKEVQTEVSYPTPIVVVVPEPDVGEDAGGGVAVTEVIGSGEPNESGYKESGLPCCFVV